MTGVPGLPKPKKKWTRAIFVTFLLITQSLFSPLAGKHYLFLLNLFILFFFIKKVTILGKKKKIKPTEQV